jgi:methylenetetrahydrofolate reductase (NADPH)
MQTLREKLENSTQFLIGTELVSIRGGMEEESAVRARDFANQLAASPAIDWISITDNAGGNPQLAPSALGKPLLYAGKEVVIHVTCKDLNRNGLESEAWMLHSEGFNNILAMTGDYPVAGNGGTAKPVFDLDSVSLIAMLSQMNRGLDPRETRGGRAAPHLERTNFLIGAVTTNFKLREGEVMPQYAKLEAKIRGGARFIVNQIGFDARKISELRAYVVARGLGSTPLIGNVYLLNLRVARMFSEGRIPGVVVSRELLDVCEKHAAAADHGAAFFSSWRQSRWRSTARSVSAASTSAASGTWPRSRRSSGGSGLSGRTTGRGLPARSASRGRASFFSTKRIRRRDWLSRARARRDPPPVPPTWVPDMRSPSSPTP